MVAIGLGVFVYGGSSVDVEVFDGRDVLVASLVEVRVIVGGIKVKVEVGSAVWDGGRGTWVMFMVDVDSHEVNMIIKSKEIINVAIHCFREFIINGTMIWI